MTRLLLKLRILIKTFPFFDMWIEMVKEIPEKIKYNKWAVSVGKIFSYLTLSCLLTRFCTVIQFIYVGQGYEKYIT